MRRTLKMVARSADRMPHASLMMFTVALMGSSSMAMLRDALIRFSSSVRRPSTLASPAPGAAAPAPPAAAAAEEEAGTACRGLA